MRMRMRNFKLEERMVVFKKLAISKILFVDLSPTK